MVVVLRENAPKESIDNLTAWLKSQDVNVHISEGKYQTVLGLVGNTTNIDEHFLESLDIISSVKRISEPFKNANRKFHPDDSIIDINGIKIGGGNFQIIAGPCSIESPEQIAEIATAISKSGAGILRGGAFKPRTSPYAFQGLRADGIELLEHARDITGLPIITEIMDASHLPLFENVDIIQVGARNMQNFELLKELGKTRKPILLKRGLANTIQEFLMSAEYIMAGGNENIILCERGIRTFETATRNTLDLSAIPVLKELSHLPVVVDPSHACGISRFVKTLSLAAVAAGADGLMIEVHNNPQKALCDGAQSLTPEQFEDLCISVNKIREVL